jgi:hypothetical protein
MGIPKPAAVSAERFEVLHNMNLLFNRYIEAPPASIGCHFVRVVLLRLAEISGNGRVNDIVEKPGTGNDTIKDEHCPGNGRGSGNPAAIMVQLNMGKLMGKDERKGFIAEHKGPFGKKDPLVLIYSGVNRPASHKVKALILGIIGNVHAIKEFFVYRNNGAGLNIGRYGIGCFCSYFLASGAPA